jgi:dissimilatory sulfite reductase related protein
MQQTATNQTDIQIPSRSSAGEFDGEGFLLDHNLWSEAMAQDLARQEGVGELSEQHWQLLHYIRERYLSLGALPNMRLVCRATGIPRHKVHHLFGSCLSIWRIAGLPDPGEEVKAYLN